MWPALVVAGLGALAFADLRSGLPVASEIWYTLGNLVDIVVVTLGMSRLFKGVPRLNSVKALAQYIGVAVILAPFASAFVGATPSLSGGYWLQWRVWFFADALAFLTVTPAILSWAQQGRAWARKSRNYLELAGLLASLVLCGYFTFMGAGRTDSPVLLYSLVPLLLWAALRFGVKGVSTSVLVVALMSIWGSVHDRGPFTGQGPLNNVLSLQLFLFFAAIPFFVLAVLVEEHRRGQQALIDEQAQLTEAQRLAEFGSWQWDPGTDTIIWSAELYRMAGYDPALPPPSFAKHEQLFTPESWDRLKQSVQTALQTGRPYELDLEAIRPDGTRLFVTSRGEVVYGDDGRPVQLRGTLQNVTERKRAEAARFRHAAIVESSEDAIISKNLEGIVLTWNMGAQRIFGYSESEAIGQPITILIPPELREEEDQILRSLKAGERIQHFETVRVAKGGKRIDVSLTISPVRDSSGRIVAASKIARDITERKLTEKALHDLTGRLIKAQEEERMRIGRELHDDFSQRLALQAIGLGQLWEGLPESEVAARAEIQQLLKVTDEVTSDMHSLSHQLHSSKLEHMGLASAVRGLCEEIERKYDIRIDFTEFEVRSGIPKDLALCLFRITQEALGNIVKHSESKQAEVELYGAENELRLRIADAGVGFDPNSVRTVPGIGLPSMSERLRLVGGTLSVWSAPTQGTEIIAQVPLSVLAEPEKRIRIASDD